MSTAAATLALRSLPPAGERLIDRMRRRRAAPLECLTIARGIARALERWHARPGSPVYAALRPDTVTLGPGPDEVVLDPMPAADPDGHDLHYIAPEQTGRIARAVDARADFYALGVVLYELATGARPLAGESARLLDVVHAHVARTPAAPAASGVPRGLSDLVLRLLAKAPEDRYQSAAGLLADLARCAEAIARGEPDAEVALGLADRPPRLALPSRLYGRQDALARIEHARRRAAQGHAPLVVVDGPSGVGKSALVAAARAPVREAGGLLVTGKFDQLRRGGPYSALAEAMRGLVFGLLAGDPARLERTTTALRHALADDAPWLLPVVPEARALLGPTAPPHRASPAETQARVARAVARFLRVVAAHSAGPLLLFIDDLQWADVATLEVLRALLLDERGARVLLVCARRTEALDSAQAASALVTDVARLGVPVEHLELAPLAPHDTAALVRDTFPGAPGADALAELVHQRTDGNPFFVGQLLGSVVAGGLITFDGAADRWTWDLEAVRRSPRSDDVLELITARLVRLAPEARALLATATMLGRAFDVATLALIAARPAAEVAAALEQAARDGFVDRAADAAETYAFVHDRVQQAAAAPLGAELGPLHAEIARKLLAARTELDPAALHAIAAHAAAGAAHLGAEDSPRLAEILVEAMAAARAAAAFAQAAEYGERALELLARQRLDGPVFRVLLEIGECWGAAGELERAFACAARAGALARTAHQSAQACELEVVLATTATHHERAIDAALRGLALLGIRLGRRPPKARVVWGLMRTKLALAGRSDASIEALPRMEDPDARVAVELLLAAMAALFQTGDLDLFALCCFEVVRATLAHGHSPGAGFGFVCYGMVTIAALQDYPTAERFGRLGVRLAEAHGDGGARCRAAVVYGMFVSHWTQPREDAARPLARAHALGCEAGEMAYAGYAYGFSLDALSTGPSLDATEEALVRGQAFTARTGDRSAETFTRHVRRLYQVVRGERAAGGDPSMPAEDFARLSLSWQYWWFTHLLLVGLLVEDEAWIAEARAGAERHVAGSACSWQSIVHNTYAAVTACRRLGAARGPARRALAAEIGARRGFIARWARACPSTGRAYLALIDGAHAEARGRADRALDAYERATTDAQAIAHWPVALLASRAAAGLATRAGRALLADAFAARAAQAAEAWGARGLPERRALPPADPRALAAPRDRALGGVDAEVLTLSMQALSRELSLAPLISALLDVAVRSAGATRGALVRTHGDQWQAMATAEVLPGTPEVRVSHGEGGDPTALPQAILHLAAHRSEPLVLADARVEPELGHDPYVQARGTRALMVLPIVRHGRTGGLLLLENELVSGAFTPERVALLALLSAQIAISLENAELYEDLKKNNASLAVALEDARGAARAKSILLANVSHELRTPLNGVVGVAELLAAAGPVAPDPGLLRALEEASDQLVRGVGGLIAYTEAESGSLRLDVAPFDVARVLARAVEGHRRRARDKGLELVLDVAGLPPGIVRGDSVRLGHLLGHLVDNGLEFTERGAVTVRAHGRRDGDRCALTIEVEDTGCGMSAAAIARAFDALHQADSSSTKVHGGLGLGLAQVRRTVELMGGTVSLRSREGAGTTATVALTLEAEPLEAVAPPAPPERARAPRRPLVLVAEDNPVNQRVLTMMLTRLGLEHRVCADGAQAVAAHAAEGARIGAVLMDCQMPVMDGFEATLRIRARERAEGWARVPIIAVTANALAADRDKCLDAGMDEHLAKPVRLPALAEALRALTEATASAGRATAEG